MKAKLDTGLTAEQLDTLTARYFDYYAVKSQTIPSWRELAQMHYLEQIATNRQLNRLLRKYGRSVASEFREE